MTNQQVNSQQLIAQAVTSALTVSVFASAMGMLIAAAGVEAMPAGIKGAKPTRKGIVDLRSAFGTTLVNKAIANVSADDIITLAREVERLYVEEMRKKYGDWATEQALEAAPAGDVRIANEIALALSQTKVTSASTPEKKQIAVDKGKKRGGRKVAQPVKDTITGIVYHSKASAGMAVAAEYDLDPKNHFIWYEVIKKDPKRFVKVLM